MLRPLILLLEDNPDDVELMRHALRECDLDCRLTVVEEGRQALDFLAALVCPGDVRLLILDLKVPGLDGLEVLGQVKADPRTRSIPALVLTSSELPADVARAYALGANAFLRKPVTLAEFVELVEATARFWFSPSLVRA